MNEEEFIPSRKAVEILKIHPNTLRKLDELGQIQTIRTPGKQRLYNVKNYIDQNVSHSSDKPPSKKCICYCRVSTPGQKDDLQRQIEFMQKMYPTYEVITDIGSGINFKRKGLQTILDLAHRNKIEVLVVAYRDRLCRFGFDLFEHILQSQSNAKIVVFNEISSSPEQELVNDLIQIITVFGARINGLRKYSKSIKEDKDISK